jgi:hypothetical protein
LEPPGADAAAATSHIAAAEISDFSPKLPWGWRKGLVNLWRDGHLSHDDLIRFSETLSSYFDVLTNSPREEVVVSARRYMVRNGILNNIVLFESYKDRGFDISSTEFGETTFERVQSFINCVNSLDRVYPDVKVSIPNDPTENLDSLSYDERLARIEAYAVEHPDRPISSFVKRLFPKRDDPQLIEGAPILPETPPEAWADRRDRRETPVDFIRRVYSPWLGHGLNQADIRRIDRKLYMSLHNWLRTRTLPDDLPLPTLKESNDRLAGLIRSEGHPLPADGKELNRLGMVLRRRASRSPTP